MPQANIKETTAGRRTSRSGGVSRRDLLAGAAGMALATLVPRHVLGGAGQTAPSDKVTLAGVGVGGVGYSQLQHCEGAGFQLAVLCDCDDVYAKKAFDRWPQARRYRDYREMFQAEGDKIDAVYCGTPDHTHAVIVREALRHKKHVQCVKPLTRTIDESRVLMDAARQAGVATQVTAAPSTSLGAKALCDMIWKGAIGEIREVCCWSNRPIWPQGMARPEGEDPVPESLDWDLWLGPAPERPFKEAWPEDHLALKQGGLKHYKGVYHPFNFRGWFDFGTGALGDMGCHHFNTMFRALKLGHPTSVEASSTRLLPETHPLAARVTWEFPAREGLPPVTLTWYDGGLKPPRPAELEPGRRLPDQGNLYIGSKGKILGGTSDGRIIPEERMQQYMAASTATSSGSYRRNIIPSEWLAACRGGPPANCNFDVAGLLTEIVLLGNIAIRTRKKLDWDAEQMRFTNDEQANQYIREEYRSGWSL